MHHKHFDPAALLRPRASPPANSNRNRILVVLNAPLEDLDLLEQVFRACPIRICADGGANRVFDFLKARGKGKGKGEEMRLVSVNVFVLL